MIKILIILIVTIFTYNSYSQDITSAGKEFYFAFPPNYHTLVSSNDSRVSRSDSLYVFIAAEEATKGYIEINDIYGNSNTYTFEITNPDKVYTFSQSFWNYEMISEKYEPEYDRFRFNFGNPLRNNNHNEKVTKLSWKVVSEKDVSVTIQSQALKSTDATLLFPVRSLGKNYIVASYETHNSESAGRTPSQFVIIATEDNTNVTIRPSANTYRNGINIQQIKLDAGETYLVQSDMEDALDLTGTEIRSDKKIAVFGSQMRARVPHGKSGLSRDFLFAQNLPTSVWGKSAFSIPFVQIPQEYLTSLDLTRIIAGEDETEVYVNGTLTRFIQSKGSFFEIENNEAMYITANKKISVIQYKKSQVSLRNEVSIADPFMMINPPQEQFLNKYKIISPRTQEIDTDEDNNPIYQNGAPRKRVVFSEHYVNIVIPQDFKNTIKINGNLILNSNWSDVPSTDFDFAQIKVDEGTNIITADTTFGIYSYGYGDANSYGYVGGLALKSFDEEPPKITKNPRCYEVEGTISDSLIDDTGINTISESENDNISLSLAYNADSSVVSYIAKLNDIYSDGKTIIKVNDNYNLESKDTIEIPGFTININESIEVNDIVENIPSKDFYCQDYTMENYGSFVQEILDFQFLGDVDLFSTNLNFPFKLNPGEKIDFQVCFEAEGRTGQHEISVSLVTSCITEERMRQLYIVKPDEKKPEISASFDNCSRNIALEITEFDDFDFGIKEYRVIDSLNVNVSDKGFNAINLNLNIEVIDPYQDAFISIEVEDSAGFISTFEREIPGHTLSFGEEKLKGVNIDLGNVIKSSKNCVKVPIYNYGIYPITYNNYRLMNNYNYSIPLSQFPMTIMPNDSNYLEICMSSDDLGQLEIDTLYLTTLCIETPIPMESFIIREILESNSKCDLRLIIKEKTEFEGFGEIFPNPVNDKVNIEIASIYEGDLKYYILDNSGSILDKNTINIGQGLFILEIDVSNLINGNYTLIFEFESNRISRKFIVNK